MSGSSRQFFATIVRARVSSGRSEESAVKMRYYRDSNRHEERRVG